MRKWWMAGAAMLAMGGGQAMAATTYFQQTIQDSSFSYSFSPGHETGYAYGTFTLPSMDLKPGDVISDEVDFSQPLCCTTREPLDYGYYGRTYFFPGDANGDILQYTQGALFNYVGGEYEWTGLVQNVQFAYASRPTPIPIYTNGFFNLSTAPEPSSWALMLLGLAGTGAALRRRQCGHGLVA